MLKLINHITIDSPTGLRDTPLLAISGIAAMYISVDSAGNAAISPRKPTSHFSLSSFFIALSQSLWELDSPGCVSRTHTGSPR